MRGVGTVLWRRGGSRPAAGSVETAWGGVAAECSGVTAVWVGVKAAWGLSAVAWRRRRGGVGVAWGLHLNGRRMPVYLSYFVPVDVLVFVLVDERLI